MIMEILTGSGGGGFCPICKIYWGGFCPRQQKRVEGFCPGGGGGGGGILSYTPIQQILEICLGSIFFFFQIFS